jgi:hypothetical protein
MIPHRVKLITMAAALSAFWAHGAAAAPVMGAGAIHKAEAAHGSSAVEVRYYYYRGHHYRYRYNNRYYHYRRYRHGHWHYY